MIRKILSFLCITVFSLNVFSQVRTCISMNDGWKFHPGGFAFAQRAHIKDFPVPVDDLWEKVSLPHTWNASDPFDDSESYMRGIGWYRKNFKLDSSYLDRKVYLFFEGANQRTDVYVNGAFAGSHRGGYSAFTIDITKYIVVGEMNLLAVKVDNSHDNTIPPLSVGYGLYGGIYRDLWLKSTNPIHIGMLNYGSSGVFVQTPVVSRDMATVRVNGDLVNETVYETMILIKHTVLDPKGNTLCSVEKTKNLNPGEHFYFTSADMEVLSPALWTPETPSLYTVKTEVFSGGHVVDEVSSPLGFRWYSFDPDNGFFLNGSKYILKGTNRHQDYEGLGSALPNSLHLKDLEWIKKMGANFLRLAHYPQDPVILETADKLGLLIWEEIPVINYVNRSEEFRSNTRIMLKEMIRQHYNHPCIILWGTCNEIFLWNEAGERAGKITDEEYKKWVHGFVHELDSLARAEDPYRWTTLAMHVSDDYHNSGIDTLPMVSSYNIYEGWYGGTFDGFGKIMDRLHKQDPRLNIFISEYGAGSDGRINSTNPQRFDFSGNWQRLFHENYIRQINERPWLSGTAVWNQFDFSQPHTGGSIQHINQKGLQAWNREPKDSYYLYKANWSEEPVLYIASREWKKRFGIKSVTGRFAENNSNHQPVDVYTNLKKVELYCNGKSLGTRDPDSTGKITWLVEFTEGENRIYVKALIEKELIEDFLTLEYKNLSTQLYPGNELYINAGSGTIFTDNHGAVWLPGGQYAKGFYGYHDGQDKMAEKDLIITLTGKRAPVFNYFVEGISSFQVDVPDGNYFVEVFLAESECFEEAKRIFDVYINNKPLFQHLDITKDYGFLRAMSKGMNVKTVNGKGIKIDFNALTGKTILNGIFIKRLE